MSAATGANRWAVALRFARRELRGGLRGFRVLLACLALGVAAIAGVGSVTSAIDAGLAAEGRKLLGGDLEVELTYRFAEDDERAALAALGAVSETVDFRGMTRTVGPEPDAAVVQAKAVDAAYPLVGAVRLDPPIPLADALADGDDGVAGAVADPALIARLALEIGDRVRFGAAEYEVRAALLEEPDRLAGGFNFGPRFMIARAALDRADVVRPGTLYETEYRVALDGAPKLGALRDELLARFEGRGWRWRDSRAGAPGAERVVGQIGAFLILVGLAALAVGGVGVGASARAFLDSKVETIATLKTLGADGATVMRVYLLQIGALAAVGVAIGVAVGGLAPLALAPLLAESLPAPTRFGLYAEPLIEAALFGLAVAFLFALWPLARARQVRAAGLFRDLVAPTQAHPGWDVLIAIGALAAFLAAAAAVFTGAKTLSLGFVGGVAAALALLTLAAQGVAWIARRLARSRAARGRLALRLALSSVGGAGGSAAETRSAVLALGLGLTVLTAIGLVDVNLRRFVTDQLPATAPAYFFIDIQNADLERFVAQAEAQPGVERIETAPMLRGVITRINGVSSSDWLASGRGSQDFEWVLRGDRGVTYAAEPPQGTQIVDGDWWPADYSGAPQVSFGAEQAQGLGLRLGDEITVNVFGRDITAEITSFRKVEFRSGGINFLMVFDPGVLRGAPHAHIATIYGEEPSPGLYLRELARAFPTVTAVRSAEFLARVEQVLRDLAAAARAGAAVTLITGLVVLLGAAAASQRRQIYEAAILKTLGASRGALIAGLALRAAMFGAAAGVVAIGAGALGAWAVITFVLNGRFQFDAATAAFVVLAGVFATLAASAAFAYGPLSARPARVLRSRE